MNHKISMTEGPLLRNILLFSVPLMFSNLLQVVFNMSDIAVVGQFAGPAALGAVGSCATLTTLFTGLMIGMGSGINAIVARYMGANDTENLQKTVSSSFLISLLYSILAMGLGLLAVQSILLLLKTKTELMPGALLYMRVYLLGMPAMALYNWGNGILSAAGDSKRPLLYLFIAGVLNIALNLVFVIVFQLGVMGVALASVIAQYLSAVLILIRLLRCREEYTFSFGRLRYDGVTGGIVFKLGFSAGLQHAIFSVANLFIQLAVNSFDTVMVEGNSAAANADAFIYDMMGAFYVACTGFMAQNFGAGKRERILKTYRICMVLSLLIAALAGVMLLLFGREFLSLFTTEETVITAGMKRISIMAWCYCVSAFMDCTIAASRGLGKTVVPTIIVVLGSCVFRIIWIYTIFAHFQTIPALYLLYIFSWTITAVFEIIYFRRAYQWETAALPDAG